MFYEKVHAHHRIKTDKCSLDTHHAAPLQVHISSFCEPLSWPFVQPLTWTLTGPSPRGD